MTNYSDIQRLIEEGESTHVEFKRKVSSPEKIARTIGAFANTRGGCILFGVDDDGSVVGVESEKGEMEFIRLAGSSLNEPSIEVAIEIVPYNAKKDVIICTVNESTTKPHKLIDSAKENGNTNVYIRINDTTMEASKEVVNVLKKTNGNVPLKLSIGENEKRLFRYLEEHERITKEEFCNAVNISQRRASRILVNLVRAGVLFIHTFEKRDFYTLV